jgi:hypothetical protein
MPDSNRAVEVVVRGSGGTSGYGSGYCLGAGLVLTCAHILTPGDPCAEVKIRDTQGRSWPANLAWRNGRDDIALISLIDSAVLPTATAPLGLLPRVTGAEQIAFVMWGWPRAGEVPLPDSRRVRDVVQVDGQIKLAEVAASKLGLVRLRPDENYPALEKGSYWTGMSGAAVHCRDHVIGVQYQQPDAHLTGYLTARTLERAVLDVRDDGRSGIELLEATGVEVHALTLEQVSQAPETGNSAAPSAGRLQADALRPYLLLETGSVVGRKDLQREIAEFIEAPADRRLPLLLLIGVAGIGKSALAWNLWKQLQSNSRREGRHLFWYSFYDGRSSSSFQTFLDHLGRFLGVEQAEPGDSRTSADDVLAALAANPTILISDGIERCLRSYQRRLTVGELDAIQVQETEALEWGARDLAFSTDEALRFFLQVLDLQGTQLVGTSRVMPSDFLASGGALRAGVKVEMVGGLDPEECFQLLRAVGLEIEEPLSEEVARTFGGHPLALQLFARRASRSLSARQNLGAWMRQEGYYLSQGKGAAEIRRNLFAKAVEELSPTAKQALVVLGALGGDLDQLTLFEVFQSDDFTEQRFEEMIDEMASSGLCVVSGSNGIACHALTALAASDELEPGELESLSKRVVDRLAARFQAIDTWGDGYYEWFMKSEVSDRVEALALCRALLSLQRFAEAAEVYIEQIDLPMRYVLGANLEAVELLRSLVAGLAEEEDQAPTVDLLGGLLAHHLLMLGRINDAEAAMDNLSARGRNATLTAAEIALHHGRFDAALRLAAALLHDVRADLNYAFGYDYGLFQIMGGKMDLDIGGPSAWFIEAAVLCSRILVFAERRGEAALLLAKARALWQAHHSQCDGCRGLIARACGEMMALDGSTDLGTEVEAHGRHLQESQGKTLQGLPSRVVVHSRALVASDAELDREFLEFLSDNGFVLYQLMLETAAAKAASIDPTESDPPRARGELITEEAKYALALLDVDHEIEGEAVEARSVAGCIGWLVEERAQQDAGEAPDSDDRGADPDAPDSIAHAIDNYLAEAIAASYPEAATAVVNEALAGENSGQMPPPEAKQEVIALLPVWERIEARRKENEEDAPGTRKSLLRAIELDPCGVSSLARLAEIEAASGNDEAALGFARGLLLNASSSLKTYRFVTELVSEEGAVADEVRQLLSQCAWDDHGSPGAYLALANLEVRLQKPRAAHGWHEQGLSYPATTLGKSYRMAHHLGLALNRHRWQKIDRDPDLKLEPNAQRVAAYLFDCALSDTVPRAQAFVRDNESVDEDLYESVREWMAAEAAKLEAGERLVDLINAGKLDGPS